MSLKSDQRMEVWIFCDVIQPMIWLHFLLVHGEFGNPGIYGKDKTDQPVSHFQQSRPALPLPENKKKKRKIL